MMTMVGFMVIGLITCILLAPETRGLNLPESSGAVPSEQSQNWRKNGKREPHLNLSSIVVGCKGVKP